MKPSRPIVSEKAVAPKKLAIDPLDWPSCADRNSIASRARRACPILGIPKVAWREMWPGKRGDIWSNSTPIVMHGMRTSGG